jgi:hypothetical protein
VKQATLAAATIATMIGTTATFVYFMLFEPPPVEYVNLPFPVQDDGVTLRPGDVVPMRIKRCNRTDQILLITAARTFENIDRRDFIAMPATVTQVAPGCTENVSIVNRLPKDAPPGTYRVVGMASMPGRLRTHNVVFFSEPFQVVEGWNQIDETPTEKPQ